MTRTEALHLSGLGLGGAAYPLFIVLLLLEVTVAPVALIGLPIGLIMCKLNKPDWMR